MFKPNRILSLGVVAYVLLYFAWCILKFNTYTYDDFDLAHHDQMVWNLLHGRIFNSILGIDFLGNHVHFLTFLVVPIYYFFPHPLFLLFLQTLFLAAGAFPLYALARRYLQEQLSLAICFVYLLYPALGYVNLFEFHPTCFATFFLLCCAYYFYKEEFILFNVFMFLSLLSQENMALIFFMWGIYALLLKKEWKWVWWPTAVGFVYFLLCVEVILPHFNHHRFDFFSIYGPLGNSLGQVALTCFLHPFKVLGIILEPPKLVFLLELFISVSFVPLLSLGALLPVFLIFLQHLLSSRLSEISLHYHYTAEMIPFIFVALVFGLKKLCDLKLDSRLLVVILIFNAVLTHAYLGPHFHLIDKFRQLRSDHSIAQKNKLVAEIPPDASVVTTFNFLSHLSHRENLYSFHYVYYGYYTLSQNPYHLPDGVQYALIDFNDWLTFDGFYGYDNYRHLVSFFKGQHWGVLDIQNDMVLFKKGIKDQYPLFDFDTTKLPTHPVDDAIDNHIKLYGYDVTMESNRIKLELYWKALSPEVKDLNLFIDFIDKDGKMIGEQIRPIGYRIWPTQAWTPGQNIKEYEYINVSDKTMAQLKEMHIGFFDFITGKIISSSNKVVLSL